MKRPTEAWRSTSLFEQGIGQVVVARFKGDGEAEAGIFLLDVNCLGVKNAFFTRVAPDRYEHFLDRLFPGTERTALSPGCARRLIEDAVGYAARLGLAPHPDYRLACRVFGGIHASECSEGFAFGREGKPLYIQGPHDSPSFVRGVLASLEARCGAGNFDYLVLAG